MEQRSTELMIIPDDTKVALESLEVILMTNKLS